LKRRWKDNIKTNKDNLREMVYENVLYTELTQDRITGWDFVIRVMNLWVP
jgi:hypothetical protein